MTTETEVERRQFRKKLKDLTDVELLQWSFLVGLAARIDCELLVFRSLFAPDTELEPGLDTQIAGLNLMLTQELKRRSNASAKAKLQKLPLDTEGEHEHANHAENGNH